MKKTFYILTIALFATFNLAYGQSTKNGAKSQVSTSLIDVWDFGAEQLNPAIYNNQLSVAIINGWYPVSYIVGGVSSTYVLPTTFTVGILTWTGGSNDRLRTANTALTRYDTPAISTIGDSTLAGYLYVNSAGVSSRYLTLTLNEDDEVTIYVKNASGTGRLNFVYGSTPAQADITAAGAISSSTGAVVKFVAKKAGSYKIYDTVDKPFYYRILRKAATYKTITGTVNTTEGADIPAGYGVIYTNAAGKSWTGIAANDNTYSVNVPSGYTYNLSLANANGYIISTGKSIDVTDASTTFNLSIKKVELYNVTGTITGLSSVPLAKMSLLFTNSISSPFVPVPVINTSTGTYSVQLEATNTYTISTLNINDYSIPDNSITLGHADATKDIAFTAKPVYTITLDLSSLTTAQQAALTTKFTNLNETGYSYTFTPAAAISLRDGTYAITCSGLDAYPLQLGLTSNLKVNGAPVSKTLVFSPVTDWSFDDATISTTTTANYKGMQLSGTISNNITSGHLILSGTATVKIPMNPGQKAIITYYYTANFTVEGGSSITTNSLSTNLLETTQYTYTGTLPGYATITNVTGTTTYLPDIMVVNTIPYSSQITVGVDKTYKTINDALAAVRAMVRPTKQRVNIMVDPGNYEEMLIIDVDSVSIINASSIPSIALANQGIDINANAVRITSYYGHGYNYFSMAPNQKWSADALRVNKDNGYTNYANTGAGTTNNSYWNTTVYVSGAGFQASNIIFENSFNQYVSKKESQDVLVTQTIMPVRSTTFGSVAVQNKSFVERAAAIAYAKSGDKSVLYKCRIVGRQDSFYGAEGARVVTYKGSLMGGTDYIFGGMTLVAYKSDLAMNTSEVSTDMSYITAPQQTTSRGFLLDSCKITSAQPGLETASTYLSKPGEFGRPWAATTGEAVFFHTKIESTNNPSFAGKSLISPEGWLNTLSGTSPKCYEFGTVELSGENNQSSRASWSTILTTPTLTDATPITTFNFTKGTDNWDPLPALMATDAAGIISNLLNHELSSVQVYAHGNQIFVSNVKSNTKISIYSLDGSVFKSLNTNSDTNITVPTGLWVAKATSNDGTKVVKLIIK
jgi:hypothetical protein